MHITTLFMSLEIKTLFQAERLKTGINATLLRQPLSKLYVIFFHNLLQALLIYRKNQQIYHGLLTHEVP